LAKENRLIHFDERGLGFYAQGFAKACKAPVAIIVTSGTAVANLLPSIVEAFQSRVPIIILSADRPPELRGCGANQTIDQVDLFHPFTKSTIDLAFSDPLSSDAYLASCLSFAVHESLTDPCGPVQINCMIREPLFSHEETSVSFSYCQYEPALPLPPLSSLEKWGKLLSSYTKGIIILGSDAMDSDFTLLTQLAEHLGFPIFSDILSGARGMQESPFHIKHFDLILKTFPNIKIEAILHIGNRITSKTLTTWLKNQGNIPYFFVADHSQRQDPFHQITHRLQSPTSFFCKNLLSFLTKKEPSWALSWKEKAEAAAESLSDFFTKNLDLTEPFIACSLSRFSHFFFSNSMPIRDADLFLFPSQGPCKVFANRGASGIDGNIATAIGIGSALNQKAPLITVLGDLATLHDLNSLALWQKSKTPIFFLILNNQGGAIFSFLPIAEKQQVFEELIATSHSYHFAFIAKTFNIPYFCVSSLQEWKETLDKLHQHPETCIIECKTDRKNNVFHHEQIYEKLRCLAMNPSAPQ
jgi:2-succinyl-5-enolpyruvyl-6-hydroxy-3-cyclohexene-1-carboxylate synthase